MKDTGVASMPRGAAIALVFGAALGLAGVAAGAFGAHALRDAVSPRDLEIWKTAAHYQQLHAGLLVGVAALGRAHWTRALQVSAVALVVGILVFAGTLDAIVLGGPRILGAITPIGGLCLMGGWLGLLVHGVTRLKNGAAGPMSEG